MKNKSLLTMLVLAFCFILNQPAHCQKAPMKYGKPDMADLQMTTFEADTSAPAVILCNYGYLALRDYERREGNYVYSGIELSYTYMMRVKILKKEGLSWGSRVFPGYSKGDVKGITFNLEDGKVVESKLKNESIFKEKVTDDTYRLRIAMPNVKVGSVIDLQVSFPDYIPNEFNFQYNVPVRWSEFILEPSKYVDLRRNYYGYIPMSINTEGRWVAKDVPAFKEEPYINSDENYIAKFEIDLLRFTVPGNYKEFTTDWQAVNRRLEESDYFGNTMQGALFLNSTAKEIESQYSNPEDRMRAAFEFVKKSVKWDENNSVYTTTTVLSYPFNKKIGNCADINLILVQLLKKLDLQAYPVVMRTRSSGSIRMHAPSMSRLNYVIACVKNGDKTYLFDATDEHLPMGLLPKRALNEKGRIISRNFTDWVDITPTKKYKQVIQGLLTLDSEGNFKGKYNYQKADYAAYSFRKSYEKFNSQDEYLKDFEKDNTGMQVENCQITDLDSIYKPVSIEYDVKIKNKVNILGDMISFNPMLFEQQTENPFKLDERKYPIHFLYPNEQLYMVNINIPDGYQVDQIPKPLAVKLPENAGSCMYQVKSEGKSIQIMFKYTMNKLMFLPTEYGQIKTFYDEMVKKQAELIVLKKIQ